MRKVVRKLYETTIDVLCLGENNAVIPVGTITMEGAFDTVKAKRVINKAYPDQNVFIGNHTTTEGVYSMDSETFMKYAVKES